ncbi:MAG: hypothetical protein GC189_08070 [Alphaproteobacteria bacterium]|nr:hypothetical protein [Alphaproteobacteria bacterium]
MRFFKLVAIAGLAATAAACANRTGDQTIAEYCANPDRANYDICKQHSDTENVRTTLSGRIAEVFGVASDARMRADRAQSTADQAMARDINCETRTVRNRSTGSCGDGYTLTSCVQTRYYSSAGGLSILRQINDSECRFNTRVLEMQVRCCYVGATPPPTTAAAPEPAPAPAPAPRQPTPTS